MFSAGTIPITVLTSVFLFSSGVHGQTAQTCEATKDNPVQICFDDPPLMLDHCSREIGIYFHVGLFPFPNGEKPGYYFTFQVARDGQLDEPVDLFRSKSDKFPLTEQDPRQNLLYGSYIHFPYQNAADISVTVTVYAEGRGPFTRTSKVMHLEDHVRLTAVIVGVSSYRSLPQLLHADEDAESFDAFLRAIFPPDALHATLWTSDNPSAQPTPENINNAIDRETAQTTQFSCSNNDWFIFYFSGHGLVGTNEDIVGASAAVATHYLSTSVSDPANLPGTSLPIKEVLNRIEDVFAGNKVVILDSCFSGSSRGSRSTPPSNASDQRIQAQQSSSTRSYKVAYILHKGVVDPYVVDSRTGSGDLLAFTHIPEQEETNHKRVEYFSAASSDHEAEEGIERWSGNDLIFTPADDEKAEDGHGLYTFVLLWNLMRQLPKDSTLAGILNGQQPPSSATGPCSIDFDTAHSLGKANIDNLRLAARSSVPPRDYQRPEVAGHSQTQLGPLPCSVQIQARSSYDQSDRVH